MPATPPTATLPPPTPLKGTQLLDLLRQHTGQEYQAQALPSGAGYAFACCAAGIQATGPSAQTRILSVEQFSQLFGSAQFVGVAPTGRLTDLGPLFSNGYTSNGHPSTQHADPPPWAAGPAH